jgi:hypothetical protein
MPVDANELKKRLEMLKQEKAGLAKSAEAIKEANIEKKKIDAEMTKAADADKKRDQEMSAFEAEMAKDQKQLGSIMDDLDSEIKKAK